MAIQFVCFIQFSFFVYFFLAVYDLIHIDLDEYPHALGKTASDPLRKVLSGELAFRTFFPAAICAGTLL